MRRALKAAALAALVAASAAAAAREVNSRTVESHVFDHETTGTKRYELRVPPGGALVRLRVKASVREGELKLLVRDSEGKVRQEARLGPSGSKPLTYDVDSGETRSAAGAWTVEVELKDAVGSYDFTWTAADAASGAPAASATERIEQTTGKHTLEHKTTETRKYHLDVPAGSRNVRLRVKALVRAGEMRIVVRDTEGRVRQDARVGPSKSGSNVYDVDSGKMPSPAGVWTIELEFRDALGSYEYTWTADVGD